MSEMNFTESKLYILDTLSTLIERCNPLIDQPTLIKILQIVPGYWEKANFESKARNLLSNFIIACFEKLGRGIKPEIIRNLLHHIAFN